MAPPPRWGRAPLYRSGSSTGRPVRRLCTTFIWHDSNGSPQFDTKLSGLFCPASAEAHLAQAWILWSPVKGFQHAEAIAALEQVLAVQPNLERAHNRMSAICAHIGRLHDSRVAHEHAQRSNPKTRSVNLEFYYRYSGDFARAEEAGEALLREGPKP